DLAYFVLLSLLLLGITYYHINPEMERYMTHLIPLLLIPGSYGIYFASSKVLRHPGKRSASRIFSGFWTSQNDSVSVSVRNFDKQVYTTVLSLFIVFQLIFTARGLRNLNDPSWFRPSYEEKAALLVGNKLSDKPMLIASFPEPYYYF